MSLDRVEIGNAVLYCGDCRDVLPDLAVDAVISDPPYGVALTGKLAMQRNGRKTKSKVTYVGFPDTPEYVESVVVPAFKEIIGRSKRAAITPGTRNLMLYPPPDDIGCFYSASGTGVGRWGFTCSQPILYYGADPYLEAARGSRANSLGHTYPNDANAVGHPCAKPLPQWLWLVGRASAEDETVLDPFMGSGTTGVACARLGRPFVGVEIEPRWFEIACRRIADAQRQGLLPLPAPATVEERLI